MESILLKNKKTLHKRNKEIIGEISAMIIEKSSRGSPKYNIWYIYDVIGERHDLESRTIKNIYDSPLVCNPVDGTPVDRPPSI